MGCIKSSPNVIICFPEDKQGKKQSGQNNSKPNGSKNLMIESAAISKNPRGGGGGSQKDNISNHLEVEGDDDSLSSRRHIKKNRGKPDKSYFEKTVVNEEKQQKLFYGVVEDNHLINEEDENALKKQVKMSQIEQQQQQKQQLIPGHIAKERYNTQSPINESDEAQKELTSANEEFKGKEEYLEDNEEDQQTLKKTELINSTEKTDITDNYQCNVLRAQPTVTSQFSLNQRSNGSISMQTSGHRLSNSNIITSGFDYENKRRELIRKISDEIVEIDEIDENNFQIGGQVYQNKQKQKGLNNNAEPNEKNEMMKTEDQFYEINHKQQKEGDVIKVVDDDNDF